MTFPVKWFLSTMGGAPRCSGTAGDLIALLDACLINGFNLLAVQSIEVSSGVATTTFGSAHGYLQHQIITISGATPTELNGEWRVKAVPTSNTLTFDCPGIADGTATGVISCKTSPAGGWEKAYADTNKGVYRSTDVQGTRLYLRVDDTGTTQSVMHMYESMDSIDNGLGMSPPSGVNYYFNKSSAASTVGRPWALIGDSRIFFTSITTNGTASYGAGINCFGDVLSFVPADNYHCVVFGQTSLNTTYTGLGDVFCFFNWNSAGGYLARSYTQSGSAITTLRSGDRSCTGAGFDGGTYPSPTNQGLILRYPVLLHESSYVARGIIPGVFQPLQARPLSHGDIISTGEKLVLLVTACRSGGTSGTNNEGRLAFDISGPWR
jgi:hypothetical protein